MPSLCNSTRCSGTPLCFASLYLPNVAGFCSTSSSRGCSAAIATGTSLVFSSLGASSFSTPTDWKTSTPCVAWLPSADESMISCSAPVSLVTFTLSATSFLSKLGCSAVTPTCLSQPARWRMWLSMSSVFIFKRNQRSSISIFVSPFSGLCGPTSPSTLLSSLTFTPSADIARHVRRRRLAAPMASKDSMARVGRFGFPGQPFCIAWAARMHAEPKMKAARHSWDIENLLSSISSWEIPTEHSWKTWLTLVDSVEVYPRNW